MFRLPVLTWIGNAAAVLLGRHGAVTEQARSAACSRQSAYDHAHKVQQALLDAQLPGPDRAQLLQQLADLQQQNEQLRGALRRAIDFPLDRQRRFTVTACALGLSLSQVLVLLAVLLPKDRLPSRATLGRWTQHSARTASRVLAVLDKACRPLVLCLCLDEIFFRRRPVLMAVEPQSLAWVLGRRSPDRTGDTWAKALAGWPQLRDVACDGGSGPQRGLELLVARRQQAAAPPDAPPAVPLHSRLDVFHIRRDGARALRQEWAHAQRLWEQAEKVDRAKERFDRQGTDRRQFNKSKGRKAWAKAEAALEQACHKEQAWQRAVAALGVIRPDGSLNDRAWAEAQLRAAAAELTGGHWAKVRRQLLDRRTLTFLDRLQEELVQAEPDPLRREGLVALWRWRRQSRQEVQAGSGVVGVARGVVAAVVQARLGAGWEQAYQRVSRVLRGVLRASSCVGCVNSVVRMHQSRHRHLSQGLLGLKRLYFNCRPFREGNRKRHCPYQLLGLQLPTYDPWDLLQMDPDELEKRLSSSAVAL